MRGHTYSESYLPKDRMTLNAKCIVRSVTLTRQSRRHLPWSHASCAEKLNVYNYIWKKCLGHKWFHSKSGSRTSFISKHSMWAFCVPHFISDSNHCACPKSLVTTLLPTDSIEGLCWVSMLLTTWHILPSHSNNTEVNMWARVVVWPKTGESMVWRWIFVQWPHSQTWAR